MRRPLWRVALWYVAGVALAREFHVPVIGLFFLCAVSLFAAAAWEKARTALLCLSVFTFGWLALEIRTEIFSPHDLRVLFDVQPQLVTLRGRLEEPPSLTVFERRGEEAWRTHATLRVESFSTGTNWAPAFGRVAVLAPGILGDDFFTGRSVEVFGVIQPPRRPLAEGLFDYREYLRWQGIHFLFQTKSTDDWRAIGGEAKPPWSERFSRWAQSTLQRNLPIEDEPLRLTWAMALGWKTALTDDVSEPFIRTGTMHIFAISGLHIALIAGILVALLRVLQMPRGACGVVAIPLIWFYTAATGWQSSAIRSTIMMTIVIAGWSLRRPSDLLNSLGAAGFIILVWQPEQLFQASFQLSFFVVLAIALFLPPIEDRVQRLLSPDPLLPPELRPRWQRWLDVPIRWLAMSFATSFAAWLGSVPLTAYYFHMFTPVSLLANLAIVPMSSAALVCNLGSVVCGDWLPWLTELFNHAGWFWMKGMVIASDWFAHLPGASWNVREPTPLAITVYYVIVLLAFDGWLFAPQRWRWTVPTVSLCLITFLAVNWFQQRNLTRITILPLGGGSSIWVDAPGRANDLLIDTGSEPSVRFAAKPFLRAQGVNTLPNLLLAHSNTRNIGGAPVVATEFRATRVVTAAVKSRSTTLRQTIGQIESAHIPITTIQRGETVSGWSVLHPDAADKFTQADDGAVVLRKEIKGVPVLLLSSLGKAGQAKLFERAGDLRADIIVAGLPRQGEPLNDALLEAINPRLIVITDSDYPASERAGKILRDRLAARNIPVIYTSHSGAVTLEFRGGSALAKTMTDGVVWP